MELRIIGCDGSYPGPNGACSSYLVTGGGEAVLLDLGCGSLPRLMARMLPSDLTAAVVTHWHFDHSSDMLGLQYWLLLNHRRLTVYSPREDHPLKSLLSPEQYDLRDLGESVAIGGFTVTARQTNHPTPARAVRLGRDGKALVYTGDTASWEDLVGLCRNADLLVCDATFTNAQWKPGHPHLSAAQAGMLARKAGVKKLVLTHFPPGSDADTLLSEGIAEFPDTVAAQPGLTIEL